MFNTKTIAQTVQKKAYKFMIHQTLSETVDFIDVDTARMRAPEYLFLDTRSKAEYNVSHIKKSLWVGYEEFDLKLLEDYDKDQKIIVYCSIGARSEDIGETLISAGFSNVVNLYGGIFEWMNRELPVYDIQEERTDLIHGYDRLWSVWLRKGEVVYHD